MYIFVGFLKTYIFWNLLPMCFMVRKTILVKPAFQETASSMCYNNSPTMNKLGSLGYVMVKILLTLSNTLPPIFVLSVLHI